jgi:hypothetical protein
VKGVSAAMIMLVVCVCDLGVVGGAAYG